MGIMVEKGYQERKKEGKGYIYKAAVREDEVTQGMLGDIVDRAFAGSRVAAMVNLLEMGDIDQEELGELRDLISTIKWCQVGCISTIWKVRVKHWLREKCCI